MSTSEFSGWAIRRNGSCVGEVDCGVTRDPFHACCPSSAECPSQYNVACCPFGQNCTAAAVETPKCANGSWAMFDNAGFFCCEKGYIGYNYRGTDGCSKSGISLPDGALPLAEISQGTTALSIASFSSSSTTSTATPTATPTLDSQSSSDSDSDSNPSSSALVGAIVGGVLGGVAFLALVILCLWFVRRRKARLEEAAQSFMLNQEPPIPIRTEKYAATVAPGQVEIDGNSRAELPNDAATKPHELA